MGPCHGTLRCRWGLCGTFVGGTWIALLLMPSLRLCRRIPRLSWVVLLLVLLLVLLVVLLVPEMPWTNFLYNFDNFFFAFLTQMSVCLETWQPWKAPTARRGAVSDHIQSWCIFPSWPLMASDSNLLQSLLVCVSDLMLRGALANQEWVRQQNNICSSANCAQISAFMQGFISMFIKCSLRINNQ